jgi:23S rRNA (uracil1939-C5)-methyltransferase
VKAGTVAVAIERIVAGGYGLARTDDGVVLVRGALPGETVTTRPKQVGGTLRGHLIEVLEPHPDRSYLELPPGADLPLAYAAQLDVKRGLVVEALERIAGMEVDVPQAVASPVELGYRAVAQYAVMPDGGLGARAMDSDRLVPLDSDPLVAEPVAAAFKACADRPLPGISEVVIRASLSRGRSLVGLIGKKSPTLGRLARTLISSGVSGVTWAEPDKRGRFRGRTAHLEGAQSLTDDFGGLELSVSVSSFSQINPPAAGALFKDAARLAGSGTRALDLYAGSGSLGMHLASAFEQVIAVELAADAVKRGKADARRLGIANLDFERADASSVKALFPADVVALDPPRAGLSEATVRLLLEHRPRRIVYVSCDPTTWARDVRALVANGYRLGAVTPYDFYPYTHHVEVLSVLDL